MLHSVPKKKTVLEEKKRSQMGEGGKAKDVCGVFGCGEGETEVCTRCHLRAIMPDSTRCGISVASHGASCDGKKKGNESVVECVSQRKGWDEMDKHQR